MTICFTAELKLHLVQREGLIVAANAARLDVSSARVRHLPDCVPA